MSTKFTQLSLSRVRMAKSTRRKFIVAVLVAGCFLSNAAWSLAERMSSDEYVIEFGNFNVTSGEKSSGNYKITDTVGQIAPDQYDGTGYAVKAGFQYIYPFNSLSLTISKVTVDLGVLTAGSFNSDSHTLIVNTNGAGGYAVKASEIHPLRLQNDSTVIRDTLCDSGTCDETTAGSWTNASNHGFGFNVSGDDIEADFVSLNFFRQFANLANGESMQTIMSGSGVSVNRTSTVTYKVAPEATQVAGTYETVVTYQLIPTY
jgi:hypothetical protein